MLEMQWSCLACTKPRVGYSPYMNWEWWCMSVILALRTLKTADDKFRVILNLHTEFEASCGYYIRPCLKNKHYCLIWPSVLQLMMTIFVHCEHIVHCPDCLPPIVDNVLSFPLCCFVLGVTQGSSSFRHHIRILFLSSKENSNFPDSLKKQTSARLFSRILGPHGHHYLPGDFGKQIVLGECFPSKQNWDSFYKKEREMNLGWTTTDWNLCL